MMIYSTCPDEQALLAAAAGDLQAQQRDVLQQHLSSCDRCRNRLDELRLIRAALPASDWDCPPREAARFASRVVQALPQRRRTQRVAWSAALASAAVAFSALLLFRAPDQIPGGSTESPPLEISLLSDQGLLEQLELLEQLDLLESLEEAG